MILILQLSLLLITAGFTGCNSQSLDLECLNDYDTEMVCRLSSENLNNCYKYKLLLTQDVFLNESEQESCSFEDVAPGVCKCKFHMEAFVIGEVYEASLWRGQDHLLSKEIDTQESIKPKRPIIQSVKQTPNGNYLIKWDTNYTSPRSFIDGLKTELSYSIKGSNKSQPITMPLENGRTEYEIVGRKLESNSNYVVMARVSTHYNNNSKFSDYSQPYEFSTSTSIQDILKIIIPISCLIVIIFTSTIFYCYIKTIKQWWEKIPTPKIAPIFERAVPHLASSGSDFSPVCLDTSKLNPNKDKMWISAVQVDSSGDSFQSLGKSGDSSQVIYAQTVSEEENIAVNEAELKLLDKSPLQVQSNKASTDVHRGCRHSSCSSFSNRCYLGSETSGSSFLSIKHTAYPSNESENSFSALPRNADTVIPTDFEYGPCNVCPVSTDSTHFTPFSHDTVVVPGYQSVNELLDHGNRPEDQIFISYHNDMNLIKAKNPLGVPLSGCNNIIIPVVDGYQSFPGLEKNTCGFEEEQTTHRNANCISQQAHAPSFKSLCGPVLNISPNIQIDCAYQKV